MIKFKIDKFNKPKSVNEENYNMCTDFINLTYDYAVNLDYVGKNNICK